METCLVVVEDVVKDVVEDVVAVVIVVKEEEDVVLMACPVEISQESGSKFRGINGESNGANDVDLVDGCEFEKAVDGEIRRGDDTE